MAVNLLKLNVIRGDILAQSLIEALDVRHEGKKWAARLSVPREPQPKVPLLLRRESS